MAFKTREMIYELRKACRSDLQVLYPTPYVNIIDALFSFSQHRASERGQREARLQGVGGTHRMRGSVEEELERRLWLDF